MEYNTTRKHLTMREYGRHVQRMVEYVQATKDPEKRQHNAQAVIELMGFLNPQLKNIEDYRHKLWDHLFLIADFDLNVKSVFYASRAVAKSLIAAKQPGSIITISSQMGHVGASNRTVYCASKHALEGMTKALSWELGQKNIRVNTICPTFIETALTKGMFEDPTFKASVVSKIALGRVGHVNEVMGSVVFLASEASSLITGSALMLDGGWTAA